MLKIASFNVENLFARPKAFNTVDWSIGRPALDAYQKVNTLFAEETYTDQIKQDIRDLLVELDIYTVNSSGAIRRKRTQSPRWAWLRKNRGSFDRQPVDSTQSVEIIADGRSEWIGWVELAVEHTDETSTRMTARVVQEVAADTIGIVEAEDRPSLVRFNKKLLGGLYQHVMLVDGNDERGIDVGIMMAQGYEIESIRSNVDLVDDVGVVFSRDCPQYELRTPGGTVLHVLVNHFKSKSGGGATKRERQAKAVRRIVDDLVARDQHVVVLGDFNEGPAALNTPCANLIELFTNDTPLVDCYSLQGFQVGNRLGTFDSCGLRNRFDYILISKSLEFAFRGGGVFRKGLWGRRKTRPTDWTVYPEIENSSQQASDHALVYVELDI